MYIFLTFHFPFLILFHPFAETRKWDRDESMYNWIIPKGNDTGWIIENEIFFCDAEEENFSKKQISNFFFNLYSFFFAVWCFVVDFYSKQLLINQFDLKIKLLKEFTSALDGFDCNKLERFQCSAIHLISNVRTERVDTYQVEHWKKKAKNHIFP